MARLEKDSIGEKEVPNEVFYGIQTARAIENFPVSGIMETPTFIKAYVLVKKAAALANMDLGELDKEKGAAIVKAADEVLAGKYMDQFMVDVYQAGAGTSFNMNVNEVLANIALEILGLQKGDYDMIGPNDHVNMAQSTNDTFPTASHIAIIMTADELLPVLRDLAGSLAKKGEEFSGVPKSGRTHLTDALPLKLGHEFNAFASAVDRAADRIDQRRDDMTELSIGGTAVGTGANAHRDYRKTVLTKLSDLASVEFSEAKDSFEALQSRSQMAAFSSSLKELAIELVRIANDLRLLSSGPTTGLAEIELPPVQPGSSIMAGKVNPVMAECLDMVAFQVIGNDTTVAMAAQAGQMDLNVMTPVMTHNILHSMTILKNYLPVFQARCVEGIIANRERCKEFLGLNPSLATLLNSEIGYSRASELAKESLKRKVSVERLAVEKGLITEEEAKELFDLGKVTKSKYDR